MTSGIADAPVSIETSTVFDRAVCLSLQLHRWGITRKVKTADLRPGVEVDADMVRTSKRLIESEEYDAIRQADGALRRYLETRTSGPALFRNGVYMLSYGVLEEVDAEIEKRLSERRNVLVPRFLDKLDAAIEGARKKLGELFHAEEYPDRLEVETAFSASTKYFTLGSPEGLEKISADIFRREQAKAESQWRSVLEESRDVLRLEMAGLVGHLVDRLTPDEQGRKKRFEATTVEKLDDFLRNFSRRTIADDPELKAIVEEARAALAGKTPERLRDNKFERAEVAGQFEQLRTRLDALTVSAGRAYNLDDE